MTEENAGQVAFWEGDPGRAWVRLQPELDELHAPVLTELLARADARRGERVIDVGCGAGTSSLAFAGRVGPHGRVVGIDISRPLLDRARTLARQSGHDHLGFRLADAQDAAFDIGSADLVASRFGVMFFADPVTAFANLRRALKPDGRLAFVAWTGADDNPWFAVPGAIATRHLGPPEPAPPRAPGPLAFAEADYVREVLTDAGFQAVEITPLEVMLIGAADAVAETAIARHVGPIARRLREVEPPPAVVDALMAEAAQAFRAFETPAGIRIPARVHLVHARPG